MRDRNPDRNSDRNPDHIISKDNQYILTPKQITACPYETLRSNAYNCTDGLGLGFVVADLVELLLGGAVDQTQTLSDTVGGDGMVTSDHKHLNSGFLAL